MKIVKFEDEDKFTNSNRCFGVEYALDDKDINCSIAVIEGRYPETGFCYNEKCKELIYVISGKGKIVLKDGSVIEFKAKDSILINKGEVYYWDADCEALMSCVPAWYPEQHKLVE